MEQGWIKLHRKLLDNALMSKSAYLQLWIALLLRANHKQNEFIFDNKKVVLQPGQFITGRDKLSELTAIPPSTIEKILKYLENEQQIEQQTTNKYRLITILNWQYYQSQEHQHDNNVSSKEQQRDTNKNDKNEKNDKNHGGGFSSDGYSQKDIVERALAQLEAEGVY
jgi:hypothetical protein